MMEPLSGEGRFVMTRRTFLGLLGCMVAGLATGGGTQAGRPKLPNIVYILADDMGFGERA